MRFIDCNPQARYVSKKAGKSAVAKFDYVTRSGKYSRHSDRAVATGSLGLPAFAEGDARVYWQAADALERKDGATLYEYIMPLPSGLTEQQQVALCEKFARGFQRAFPEGAPVVTWGLHEGHGENPHLHFCYGTKIVDKRSAVLSAAHFFKRADGTERGGAARFGTNEQDKDFLEMMKKSWRDYANTAARKAGLHVTLVGGPLHLSDEQIAEYKKKKKTPPTTQREQAEKAMAGALKSKNAAAWSDAYWWHLKTHRPVTSHLGQSASKERRGKFEIEKMRRDFFLEEAAASVEIALIERGMPVPDECAEYAARWRAENPNVFPELKLNPDYVAPLAAPTQPKSPQPVAQKRAASEQEYDDMEQLKAQSIEVGFYPAPRDAAGKPKRYAKAGKVGTAPADQDFHSRGTATRFKQKLWQRYYCAEIATDIALNIAYIDAKRGTFRTVTGDYIYDKKSEIRATRLNEITIAILIEQAKAKGWARIEIENGTPAAVAAFRTAGIEVVGYDDERIAADAVARKILQPFVPRQPQPAQPIPQQVAAKNESAVEGEKRRAVDREKAEMLDSARASVERSIAAMAAPDGTLPAAAMPEVDRLRATLERNIEIEQRRRIEFWQRREEDLRAALRPARTRRPDGRKAQDEDDEARPGLKM